MRERAIDALSQIGSPKALPKLESMLGQNPKTDTVIIRALAKLGNAKHIARIVPLLKRPERDVQIEVIKALVKLTDESQAETIRGMLKKIKQADDATIVGIAVGALRDLDARFSATVLEENERAKKHVDNSRTLLVDGEDLDRLLKEAKAASRVGQLDADEEGEVLPAAAAPAAGCRWPDRSTSPSSSRATSSMAATGTSKKSARARSVPCC